MNLALPPEVVLAWGWRIPFALGLYQVARVPESLALGINTAAMGLLLIVSPVAGLASDRWGRRSVLAVSAGGLALFAYPLMAPMARGMPSAIFAGQAGLALLIGTAGGALPAAMAELTPWRVRCRVLSVGYNVGMALLGGTTPMVATWLLVRNGHALAPAVYLAMAAALALGAALFLPRSARHGITQEFSVVRFR